MIIHGARPKTEPEVIERRLIHLKQGLADFSAILHLYDGTQPDMPMGVREMAIANTHLETAYLWAKRAIEEN